MENEVEHVLRFLDPTVVMRRDDTTSRKSIKKFNPDKLKVVWKTSLYRVDASRVSSRDIWGLVNAPTTVRSESYSMTFSHLDAIAMEAASDRKCFEFIVHVHAVDFISGTILSQGSQRVAIVPKRDSDDGLYQEAEMEERRIARLIEGEMLTLNVPLQSVPWLRLKDAQRGNRAVTDEGLLDGTLNVDLHYTMELSGDSSFRVSNLPSQRSSSSSSSSPSSPWKTKGPSVTPLPVDLPCSSHTMRWLTAHGPWERKMFIAERYEKGAVAIASATHKHTSVPRPFAAEYPYSTPILPSSTWFSTVYGSESLGLTDLPHSHTSSSSGISGAPCDDLCATLGLRMHIEDGSLALSDEVLQRFPGLTLSLCVGGSDRHPPISLAEVEPQGLVLSSPQSLNDVAVASVTLSRCSSLHSSLALLRGTVVLDVKLSVLQAVVDESELYLDDESPLLREEILSTTITLVDMPLAAVITSPEGIFAFDSVQPLPSPFPVELEDDTSTMDEGTALSALKFPTEYRIHTSLFDSKGDEYANFGLVFSFCGRQVFRGPDRTLPLRTGAQALSARMIHSLAHAAFSHYMHDRTQSLNSILGFQTEAPSVMGDSAKNRLTNFQKSFVSSLSLGKQTGDCTDSDGLIDDDDGNEGNDEDDHYDRDMASGKRAGLRGGFGLSSSFPTRPPSIHIDPDPSLAEKMVLIFMREEVERLHDADKRRQLCGAHSVKSSSSSPLSVLLLSRLVVSLSILGSRTIAISEFLRHANGDEADNDVDAFSRAYRTLLGRNPHLKDRGKLIPESLNVHQLCVLVSSTVELLAVLRTLRKATLSHVSIAATGRSGSPGSGYDHSWKNQISAPRDSFLSSSSPLPPGQRRHRGNATGTTSAYVPDVGPHIFTSPHAELPFGRQDIEAAPLEMVLRQQLRLEAFVTYLARTVLLAVLGLGGQLREEHEKGGNHDDGCVNRADAPRGEFDMPRVRLVDVPTAGMHVNPKLTATARVTPGLVIALANTLAKALFTETNDFAGEDDESNMGQNNADSEDQAISEENLIEAQQTVSMLALVLEESHVQCFPMRVCRYVDDRIRRPRPPSGNANMHDPFMRRQETEFDSGFALDMKTVSDNRVRLLKDVSASVHICHGWFNEETTVESGPKAAAFREAPLLRLPRLLRTIHDLLAFEDKLFWSAFGTARVGLANCFMEAYPRRASAHYPEGDSYIVFHDGLLASVGLIEDSGPESNYDGGLELPKIGVDGRHFCVLGWHEGVMLLEESRQLISDTLSSTLRFARVSPMLNPNFYSSYTAGFDDPLAHDDASEIQARDTAESSEAEPALLSAASTRARRVSAQFGLGVCTSVHHMRSLVAVREGGSGLSILSMSACVAFSRELLSLGESLVDSLGFCDAGRNYEPADVALSFISQHSLRALVVTPRRHTPRFATDAPSYPPFPSQASESATADHEHSQSSAWLKSSRNHMILPAIQTMVAQPKVPPSPAPGQSHGAGITATRQFLMPEMAQESDVGRGVQPQPHQQEPNEDTFNISEAYYRAKTQGTTHIAPGTADVNDPATYPVAGVHVSKSPVSRRHHRRPPAVFDMHYADGGPVDAFGNPHSRPALIQTFLTLPPPVGISGYMVFQYSKPYVTAMLGNLSLALSDSLCSRDLYDKSITQDDNIYVRFMHMLSVRAVGDVEKALGLVVDAPDVEAYGSVLRQFDRVDSFSRTLKRSFISNPTLMSLTVGDTGDVAALGLTQHRSDDYLEADWAFYCSLPHIPVVLPLSTLSVLYLGATDHVHDAYSAADRYESCCATHNFSNPFFSRESLPPTELSGLSKAYSRLCFGSYSLPLLNMLAEDDATSSNRVLLTKLSLLAQSSFTLSDNLCHFVKKGNDEGLLQALHARIKSLLPTFDRDAELKSIITVLNDMEKRREHARAQDQALSARDHNLCTTVLTTATLALLAFEGGKLLNLIQIMSKSMTLHPGALSYTGKLYRAHHREGTMREPLHLDIHSLASHTFLLLMRAALRNILAATLCVDILSRHCKESSGHLKSLRVERELVRSLTERSLKLSSLALYTGLSQAQGTWPDAEFLLNMPVPEGFIYSHDTLRRETEETLTRGPSVGEAIVAETLRIMAEMPYLAMVTPEGCCTDMFIFLQTVLPHIELSRQTLACSALRAVEMSKTRVVESTADDGFTRVSLDHIISSFVLEGTVSIVSRKFSPSPEAASTAGDACPSCHLPSNLSKAIAEVLGQDIEMGTVHVLDLSPLTISRAIYCLMLAFAEYEPIAMTTNDEPVDGRNKARQPLSSSLARLVRVVGHERNDMSASKGKDAAYRERVREFNHKTFCVTPMQHLAATVKGQMQAVQTLAAAYEADQVPDVNTERATYFAMLASAALMAIQRRVILHADRGDILRCDSRQLRALMHIHTSLCRSQYSTLTWRSHGHDIERMPPIHQELSKKASLANVNFPALRHFSDSAMNLATFERTIASKLCKFGRSYVVGLSQQRLLLYLSCPASDTFLEGEHLAHGQLDSIFGSGLGLVTDAHTQIVPKDTKNTKSVLGSHTNSFGLFLFREAYRLSLASSKFRGCMALIDVADPSEAVSITATSSSIKQGPLRDNLSSTLLYQEGPDRGEHGEDDPLSQGSAHASALRARVDATHSKAHGKNQRDKAELARARTTTLSRAKIGADTAWHSIDHASINVIGPKSPRAYDDSLIQIDDSKSLLKRSFKNDGAHKNVPSPTSVSPDDVYYAVRFTDMPWSMTKSSAKSDAAKVRLGFYSQFKHMMPNNHSSDTVDAPENSGNPHFLDALDSLTYARGNAMSVTYMNRFAASYLEQEGVDNCRVLAGSALSGLLGFQEEEDDFWLIVKFDGDSCVEGVAEMEAVSRDKNDDDNGSTGVDSPLPLGSYQRLANDLQDAFPEFRLLPNTELYRPQTFRQSHAPKRAGTPGKVRSGNFDVGEHVYSGSGSNGSDMNVGSDAFSMLQRGVAPRRRDRVMQLFPAFVFDHDLEADEEGAHHHKESSSDDDHVTMQDRNDTVGAPTKFAVYVNPEPLSEKRRRMHLSALHNDAFPDAPKVTESLLAPQVVRLVLSVDNIGDLAALAKPSRTQLLSSVWTSNLALASLEQYTYLPWLTAHEEASSMGLRTLRHSFRQLLYVNSLSAHELKGQVDSLSPLYHTAIFYSALRSVCNDAAQRICMPVGRHRARKLLAAEMERRQHVEAQKRRNTKREIIRHEADRQRQLQIEQQEETTQQNGVSEDPLVEHEYPTLPVMGSDAQSKSLHDGDNEAGGYAGNMQKHDLPQSVVFDTRAADVYQIGYSGDIFFSEGQPLTDKFAYSDSLYLSLMEEQHHAGNTLTHICMDLLWLGVAQDRARKYPRPGYIERVGGGANAMAILHDLEIDLSHGIPKNGGKALLALAHHFHDDLYRDCITAERLDESQETRSRLKSTEKTKLLHFGTIAEDAAQLAFMQILTWLEARTLFKSDDIFS